MGRSATPGKIPLIPQTVPQKLTRIPLRPIAFAISLFKKISPFAENLADQT